MGANSGPLGRTMDDVFERIAYGFTVASPSAITTGTETTVSINVPGVTTTSNTPNSTTWAPIAVWSSDSAHALWMDAYVSAANTVTLILGNNSGGTLTPTANTLYGVIMGRVHQRYTTPNVPGGTTG